MKQWTLRIVIFLLLALGIAAVQILAGILMSSGGSLHPPHAPSPLDQDQAAWGRAYLDLARAQDAPGRSMLLDHLNELGAQAWVLDAAGSEVAGRNAPPELKDLALETSAADSVVVHGPGNARSVLAAASFRAADGGSYVTVGRYARLGPPPMPPRLHKIRFGLSLLGAGVLLFLLLRGPRGLVREMRKALNRLAQGDVSARLGNDPVGRSPEYDALAQEFNAMADTLHATLQSQHRLIAEIIHDMHSPLTRLGLAVEMTGPAMRGEAREIMERIRRDSRRLASLSDRLLALSRLGPHEGDADSGKLDLAELAADCVASMRLEAESRERDILAELPDGPLMVRGDREMLVRAMENGLRNALDYSPPGGCVRLTLRGEPADAPHSAIISISDQGPGVDPAELGLIFRPFYRAANAENRPGDGLGLAIVQRAAVLHGGEAWAENLPQGGLALNLRLSLDEQNHGAHPAPQALPVLKALRALQRRQRRMLAASGEVAAEGAGEPRRLAAS